MSVLLIVVASIALMGAYGAAVWLLAAKRAARREQRARDEAFEQQLLHDDLTKLPNRTLFRDRLERPLARGVRGRQVRAVLSDAIDRLAPVNDSAGPAARGQLLGDGGARLAHGLRPDATLARPR